MDIKAGFQKGWLVWMKGSGIWVDTRIPFAPFGLKLNGVRVPPWETQSQP